MAAPAARPPGSRKMTSWGRGHGGLASAPLVQGVEWPAGYCDENSSLAEMGITEIALFFFKVILIFEKVLPVVISEL